MSVLEIVHVGHPALRQRAAAVTREELASNQFRRLIDDLVETMRHANGAGLAAPQVRAPYRICAIEVNENPRYPYFPKIPLTILVNPEVKPLSSRTFENYEGCLSVPNLRGLVERHAEVEISFWDRDGREVTRTVRGLTAGVYQHEIDHLDGMLFLDRVTNTQSLTTLDEFERFHKQAFVDRIAPFIEEMGG